MYSDNPMVVCAPTGSGKTVIFELCIVRLLLTCGDNLLKYKIIYMAPIKALCSERLQEWTAKFAPLGLKCQELTGDTDLDDFQVCTGEGGRSYGWSFMGLTNSIFKRA